MQQGYSRSFLWSLYVPLCVCVSYFLVFLPQSTGMDITVITNWHLAVGVSVNVSLSLWSSYDKVVNSTGISSSTMQTLIAEEAQIENRYIGGLVDSMCHWCEYLFVVLLQLKEKNIMHVRLKENSTYSAILKSLRVWRHWETLALTSSKTLIPTEPGAGAC